MKMVEYEVLSRIYKWVAALVPDESYYLTQKAWDQLEVLRRRLGCPIMSTMTRKHFSFFYKDRTVYVNGVQYSLDHTPVDTIFDARHGYLFGWYALQHVIFDLNNIELMNENR